MAIDTTKLNKDLRSLIPQVGKEGGPSASATKSSGLIKGLNDLVGSLKSFASRSAESSKDGADTVKRTNRGDSFRDEQEKTIGILDIDAPDEDAIFEANRRRAQGSIDVIEGRRDRLISEDIESGRQLSGRQRALNVGGGLSGSDFATAGAQKVDTAVAKSISERKSFAESQVQDVLGGIATRSSEQFQNERATFLSSAKDRLDLIEEFNTNVRTQAKTDIGALVTNGLTVDDVKAQEPETYTQLLEDVGGSEELLNAFFASAVPPENVLFEDTVNGRFIQIIQDEDGTQRKQTFDLGEEFRTEGLKLITKTASGQLVFGPETLTDPSQLQIYGSIGQFGKAGGDDPKDVFSFDKGGRDNLIGGGFSGTEVTQIQSDINEFGLEETLSGMDEATQKTVRDAIQEPEVPEFTFDRAGVGEFLGVDPESTTEEKLPGSFFGFGSETAPSGKDVTDDMLAFIESQRALGFSDTEIGKIIADRADEQRKADAEE